MFQHLLPLLLSAALLTTPARSSQWHTEVAQLEAQAQQLRDDTAQHPDKAELHLQLATTLHQLDHIHPNGGTRVPEAEAAYRSALALAPSHELEAGILGNLGALLMAAGRLEDCLTAMHQSLAVFHEHHLSQSPLYAGVLFNQGKALGMLGRAEQAQQAYRDAIKAARGLAPDTYAKAFASVEGFSEDQVSELESAVAFMSLSSGVDSEPSQGSSSRRKRRSKGSKRAALASDWGWLAGLQPDNHSWLRFALFHAYEQTQQYDKAWTQLVAANQLQHQVAGYDQGRDTKLLEVIRQVFVPPNPHAPNVYEALLAGSMGYQSDVPIFVVGLPRSGSTLIEQILASHSEVWGAGEDTLFAPMIPDIIQALDGISPSGYPRIAELGRRYVDGMLARVPKPLRPARIVDKMLRNGWNVGYIQLTLPKACIVHAVRHPMDVALSCYAQPFEGRGTPWAWDLDDIAAQIEATHAVMAHWDAILPGRVMRVAYEDLVADTEGTAKRLLKTCGLAWQPRVLDFHNSSRPVQTASLAQVRQKIYTSSMGKWRRYEKQLQPTYERLRPLIQQHERWLLASTGRQRKDEL